MKLLSAPSGHERYGANEARASFWIGFVVLTMISAGTGAMLAAHLVDFTRTSVQQEFLNLEDDAAGVSLNVQNARLRTLNPLVTNLAAPRDAWIRLQASVVLSEQPIDDIGILTGHIEEDMLAYLRTLTISHIEGAVGLQHLREDLNERAVARSKGAVREIILESLVIQ
ncbi:flagellar basal body-associated FliL family protein [Roseibium sp.]|uniref:flagellar basal body-associated FliL family protein n=1 Tax=Roseibium sp. TaxID=1936156 RepID=UPI003265EF84